MFVEYNTVTKTLSAKVTFFTPFCYKFIQVPAGEKYETGTQLDSVIAKTRRVQFLMPHSVDMVSSRREILCEKSAAENDKKS
jgi:hypothetical protein